MNKVYIYICILLIMPIFPLNFAAAYYIHKNNSLTNEIKQDFYDAKDYTTDKYTTLSNNVNDIITDIYDKNRHKIYKFKKGIWDTEKNVIINV